MAYPRNGFTPENISEKKKELACWLREGLIRLGPTFIKIGQQFSTRVDVLSQVGSELHNLVEELILDSGILLCVKDFSCELQLNPGNLSEWHYLICFVSATSHNNPGRDFVAVCGSTRW